MLNEMIVIKRNAEGLKKFDTFASLGYVLAFDTETKAFYFFDARKNKIAQISEKMADFLIEKNVIEKE